MDEQGFDFRPKERRDPKRFVPPPWEQDAFEQMRRAEKSEEAERVGEEDQARVPSSGETESKAAPRPEAQPQVQSKKAVRDDRGRIDDGRMLEMLAELAAEEPPVTRDYFAVAVGASLVLFALGAMLLIWGMAALVGARQTGWMGQVSGFGLGMFGVFFLGMGVWLMYRTLKQRGVL